MNYACIIRYMDSDRLYVIALAAGEASRFGSTKQLAEYAGEPLIRRAVRLAETACAERTVLVTGNDWKNVHDACAPLRGFLVRNEAYERGMGSSISCGVKAVADVADAVLLLLADQPLIDAEYIQEMIIAWNGSTDAIVCSEFSSTIGPPVIFPARYFNELMGLEGDRGARALLEAHMNHVIRIPCDAAATDIDTVGDLKDSNS